jgi:hypothetical protein
MRRIGGYVAVTAVLVAVQLIITLLFAISAR